MNSRRSWKTFREFNRLLVPILLSFAGSRLLLQTDLLFISRLGSDEVAAFGVPLRIMVIDIVVALSMAPAISVLVAKARRQKQAGWAAMQALNLSMLVGILLLLIGLGIYPRLVETLNITPRVSALAKDAVFWLTLSIPARMIGSISNMILHALGRGKHVMRIVFGGVLVNAALDYLMIFEWGFGFSGSYLSSLAVSGMMGLFSLYFAIRAPELKRVYQVSLPSWAWTRELMTMVSSEGLRVASERVFMVALMYVATEVGGVEFLAVYVVVSEFISFATMPGIAMMRSMAIHLQKSNTSQSMGKESALIGFLYLPFIAVAMLGLFFFGKSIGEGFYNLVGPYSDWWKTFVIIFAFTLPIQFYDYLVRAVFHAQKQFHHVSKIDLMTSWLVVLPLFATALWMKQPIFVWVTLLGESFISLPYLYARLRGTSI